MKHVFYAMTVVAALAATPAVAQNFASANGTAAVTVLQPLTVTSNVGLDFGRIVKPETGSGSVTLTPAATTVRTAVSAVALGGTPTAAKFTIVGEGAQIVAVNIPATIGLTVAGGATMDIATNSNVSANNGQVSLGGTLGTSGTAIVYVGGTIPVNATTTTGAYTGTFTVTATYN